MKLEGIIEVDETFVGGKNKNRHWNKKVKNSQGRSFKDKVPVFGMLERGGKVIAKVVPDTKAKTLRKEICKYVEEGSVINTDDWNYGNLNDKYTHVSIDHSKKVYAVGDVYTNTIEGFWSIFKRGIIGIYNFVSKRRMQLYVDEFTFRYNTRELEEYQRVELLLSNMYHRTKWKDLKYETA